MKLFLALVLLSQLMGCATSTRQAEPVEPFAPVAPTRILPGPSNNPYYEPRWGAPMEYKQF